MIQWNWKPQKKTLIKTCKKSEKQKKREASSSDKQCGETKFNKTNEKKNARNETDCYNNIIEKKYKAEEKKPDLENLTQRFTCMQTKSRVSTI